MKKIIVLGIDLGKNVFHLHGVDACGKLVLQKKLNRNQLKRFMATIEPCLVGMEACGGAHDWARRFKERGHRVRLMNPKFVKPFVKSNKNDFLDAEAICEAVTRPCMRFVPVKSVAQQDIQTLHRARSHFVARRTAQANQIRGFLLEYGIVVPQGIRVLRHRLPEILEDAENPLTPDTRALLAMLRQELVHLDARVAWFDQEILALGRDHEACRRLQTIPGVGPVIATALVAAVGDGSTFRNGRQLAAWLGLVPKHRGTGGRTVLLGISKRGDAYLRMLLIHGARAVLRFAVKRNDRRGQWLAALVQRRGKNVAIVALANRIARTVWALLSHGTTYQPGYAR